MNLIVQKYGGSSLATPHLVRCAAERIKSLKEKGSHIVVVVSAMGRMTDHLISLAKKTVPTPPERELDMLLTAGERISMSLLAMALHEKGIPAISFTGSQSGIITDSNHTEAKIIDIRAFRIHDEMKKGKVVIIAGFQGISREKEITTLGRGGSDTTAVALSAVLNAERCEILTDVNGLYTADPRIVPHAELISHCSYDEALELSSLGAKMHARSIELARRFNVKVNIISSKNHDPGTWIGPNENGVKMEKTEIRGITTKNSYCYVKVRLPLKDCMDLLGQNRISVRFFNYSTGEVKFLCEKGKVDTVRNLFKPLGEYEEIQDVSIVSAVGDGVSSSPELLPLFMNTIQDSGVECLLLCSNSLSITAAIESRFQAETTNQLHRKLIEERVKNPTQSM